MEKHSQQFPIEKARLLPRLQAGPRNLLDLLLAGLRAQLRGRSLEGNLGRPGLLTFLPLTTLAPACSCSLPPTSAPPGEGGELGELGNFWLQPGSNSRCAQLGPGDLPQIPRVDGKQARDLYLPEGVLAEPRELPEADRGAREGQLGGRGLPSHASPQPGFFAAAGDEFVYSQETRLPASREKGFFYRGLEGPEGEKESELASARPSESETHGRRFPTRSPAPSPLLPQLDPWDFHLAQPQTRRNQQDLSLPISAPRRVSREGPQGPRPHLDLGISNLGHSPPPPAPDMKGIVPSSLCTLPPQTHTPGSPEGGGVGPKKACLPGPGAYTPNLLLRFKWVETVGGSYTAGS